MLPPAPGHHGSAPARRNPWAREAGRGGGGARPRCQLGSPLPAAVRAPGAGPLPGQSGEPGLPRSVRPGGGCTLASVRWHPRECECSDVSARFGCTTGNALGLPPSCPEKVGLALPGGCRSAGWDLVSGLQRPRGLRRRRGRGRGCRAQGDRDAVEDALAWLRVAFPGLPGPHGAEVTGLLGDCGPWGSHITPDRAPGSRGPQHWRAPEIGPYSARKCRLRRAWVGFIIAVVECTIFHFTKPRLETSYLTSFRLSPFTLLWKRKCEFWVQNTNSMPLCTWGQSHRKKMTSAFTILITVI